MNEDHDESLPFILGTGSCHQITERPIKGIRKKPQIGFIRPIKKVNKANANSGKNRSNPRRNKA